MKTRILMTVLLVAALILSATPLLAGRNQAEDIWEQADKAAQAGRHQEAIGLYRRSLALCGRQEYDCQSSNYNGMGTAYDALNQNQQALENYRAGLRIDRQRDSKPDIALALINTGAVLYKGLERYTEAIPVLEESLSLYRSLSKQEEVSLVLTHLGGINTKLGNYSKALRYQEEALSICRQLSNKSRLADTLTAIGNTSNQLGRYNKADQYLNEALSLLRGMNEPELLASALGFKGLNDYDLGRASTALSNMEEALATARRIDNKLKIASYTNNLGIIQMKIGRYDQARRYYSEALQIAQMQGLSGLQATALNNLGQVENALANYDASIVFTRQALQLNRSLGKAAEVAVNLNNIGKCYYDMGQYDEALTWHNQALAQRRRLGNPVDIAASLDNIGAVYLFSGDITSAEKIFLERRAMQGRMQGIRLNNRGLTEAWLQSGRYAEALELLQREPLGSSNIGEPEVAEYNMLLGRALAGVGRLREGSLKLLDAYRVMEEMRSASSDRGAFLRGGGAGGRYRTYRALTAALSERALNGEVTDAAFAAYGQNLADAAFTFAEATKTRSLLERIAGQSDRRLALSTLAPDLARQESRLKDALKRIEAGWVQALRSGGQSYKNYVQQRMDMSRAMDRFVDRLRQESPQYAALNYPRPVPPAELPLGDNELLLAYTVGDNASYLFVTRKGGVAKIIRIAMSRKQLEDKVTAMLEPLTTRKPEAYSLKKAGELYQLLLAEGLSLARPGDRITIVPDGILGTLPFEILVSSVGQGIAASRFVGDTHMFSYYQSASLMGLKRVMPLQVGQRQLFALGNPVFSGSAAAPGSFRGLVVKAKGREEQVEFPPLPETETEVRRIAALFGVAAAPPNILLGADATKQELKKAPLAQYRYLHFATHASLPGMIKDVNEPFILLGRGSFGPASDRFFTLSEVLDLRLQADMVMLSACLTGIGKNLEGEGVANFARAFQSAGARRVIVSLWEVASEPAVEYVTAYYSGLKAGLGHLQALKKARDLMRRKLPHPYYWGVFILHGEG